MQELTLADIEWAVDKIKAMEREYPIIGFRLNPMDYQGILDKTHFLTCIDNNTLTVTPPYQGFILIADNDIPPGYPEPMRQASE